MAYYIRVLSKRDDCPNMEGLQAALLAKRRKAVLGLQSGESSNWTSLVLAHPKGQEIAVVERDSVTRGSTAAEELREFIEEIQDCKPQSGAAWLVSFLRDVQTICAFQHLPGTERAGGAQSLRVVAEAIWARGDAVIQADGEGFTNEDGYHILWQFSERVTGPWWMAVRQDNGWVGFQMELGNREHRDAFMAGRVPDGVRTA
jgi:hypothetical protein